MLKLTLAALALGLAGAAVAQTAEPAPPAQPADPAQSAEPAQPAMPPAEPATPAAPAQPAAPPPTTGAGIAATESLPHCSAEVRDRCIQDERFASDRYIPGRSRDNNAMHYRTSRQAEARSRRPNE